MLCPGGSSRVFEKGIERRLRKHVGLIDDVDLVPGLHGKVANRLPQFPYLVDAPVRGGIDFDDVDEAARSRWQCSLCRHCTALP